MIKYGADTSIADFSGRFRDEHVLDMVEDEGSDAETVPQAQVVHRVSRSETKTDLLMQWLSKHRLQEVHGVLVEHGYCEVKSLVQKMKGSEPFTENELIEMKVDKRGLRLRLMYKINDEVGAEARRERQRHFPELKGWLEEAKIGHLYGKLEKQGFYLVEDLVYLDRRKIIKEVMRGLGMREDDIFQIGILIYKLEHENTERSIEDMGKIVKGRNNYCWMCCGFKNLFDTE